jgi:hypothetical protein
MPSLPRSQLILATALALAINLAACGGGASTQRTVTVTTPTASAPDAKAPPADATQPGTGPVTTPKKTGTTGARTAPAVPTVTKPKGPTGNEPVRVPATYMLKGGRLTPPGVMVPPFLAIVVTVVSADATLHRLVLEVPPGARTFTVPAHGSLTVRVPGLRAGRYGILVDGRPAGGILVGDDAGP